MKKYFLINNSIAQTTDKAKWNDEDLFANKAF